MWLFNKGAYRFLYILLPLFIFISISMSHAIEIVVDNSGVGFSYTGSWQLSSSGTDRYGADYRWANTTSNIPFPTVIARWRPNLPISSTYQVYYWYSQGGNRPVDAQYIVYHNGGISQFYANQTVHGGRWNLLGTFDFSSGNTGYVELTNLSKNNNKAVIADALKFVAYAPPPFKSGGEFRGYWIDTWAAGMLSESQVLANIDTARRYNFNAVLPQVRKVGDAYYLSSREPWASNITPARFDILSTMIAYAHNTSGGKPYIEVHAWLVTYRSWVITASVSDTTNHVFFRHPEWFSRTHTGETTSGNTMMFLDPGVPEVINYLTDIYTDIIKHYNVDGIHYDYVRYPGTAWGHNAIVSTRFHQEYGYAPPTTSVQSGWSVWEQYRRDQVTALVKKVYAHAMEINPKVKVTGAFITWHPHNNDFTRTRPYNEVYQDWHYWMKSGILDASIPMNYFNDTTHSVSYRNWADFAVNSSYGRHAYIGPGVYMNSTANSVRQIHYARATSKAHGIVNYSYRATNNEGVSNTAFYTMISTQFYSTSTHTPGMIWKSNPTEGILKGHIYGIATSPQPYYNGRVVYRARVIAQHQSTLARFTTTTDGTGFYAFLNLPPGLYNIRAETPPSYLGYFAQSNNRVNAGLVSTVDFDFGTTIPVELSEFETYSFR